MESRIESRKDLTENRTGCRGGIGWPECEKEVSYV